ncbi:MAG TPA: hypothetical protein VHZ78_00485 [Rhizomicrobium sp.]|jgi:hypothetical protein|nr:hypothetical protein [Rhizomicrobium sp.]
MLKPQDKPLLLALLAVAFALALNAAVSFAERPDHTSSNYPDKSPNQIPEWGWGAAEAIATGLIAVYAIRQYRASERTSKRQLRAYLTIRTGFIGGQHKEVGHYFTHHPSLVNTGSTPAKNVRYKIKMDVFPVPLPSTVDLTIREQPIFAGDFAPQQVSSIEAVLPFYLSEEDTWDVIWFGGRTKVYVYGVVMYEDVFGDPHETTFCHWLVWRSGESRQTMTVNRHNTIT